MEHLLAPPDGLCRWLGELCGDASPGRCGMRHPPVPVPVRTLSGSFVVIRSRSSNRPAYRGILARRLRPSDSHLRLLRPLD